MANLLTILTISSQLDISLYTSNYIISKARTMTNFMDNVSELIVETNRIVNLEAIIHYFECSICLNLMVDSVQVHISSIK